MRFQALDIYARESGELRKVKLQRLPLSAEIIPQF
jgi:hypothetical protein